MQAYDYRLTIVQAEVGYGKSTALSELSDSEKPLAWYQVNEEDNDPFVFLFHLCHAFLRADLDIADLPLQFLETGMDQDGVALALRGQARVHLTRLTSAR